MGTVTNRVDKILMEAVTAATMAGVPLDMLGLGWKHFTAMPRIHLLFSYAQLEGLADQDVICAIDSDSMMSGEDPYDFFAAFVASTAASEEEHATYNPRDIRNGRRLPPALFSSEYYCWGPQVAGEGEPCAAKYTQLDETRSEWAHRTGSTEDLREYTASPFRYLNSGGVLLRVWAVRVLRDALASFAKTHRPLARDEEWNCDQSIFIALHHELVRWELLSGALEGAPRALTRAEVQDCMYPPMKLPKNGLGPFGMPAGLMGLDEANRLSLIASPEIGTLQLYRINSTKVLANTMPEVALAEYLTSGRPTETSVTGVVRSSHRLEIVPREYIDCHDVKVPSSRCAYRDAVYGNPENARAVVPLMWHFAGAEKRRAPPHFRTVYPWYTPTLWNSSALGILVRTLVRAPSARFFHMDPATDTTNQHEWVRLLPHSTEDNMTFVNFCYRLAT